MPDLSNDGCPRLPVLLSQEETAWILHALMSEPHFRKHVLRTAGGDGDVSTPLGRMTEMYSRISDVNMELSRMESNDG